VVDPGLVEAGAARIARADRSMPVLRLLRQRFTATRPLEGVRVAASLHVTSETAVLVRTLLAGGAEVHLAASNPLSTQDDTAAALVAEDGVAVHARHGEDLDAYHAALSRVLDARPDLVLDDGCDLVTTLHTSHRELLPGVRAGCEETTTGVVRLRAMAAAGVLRLPVVAVNDTATKRLFDNTYGTGQSTVDALLRATHMLLAGKVAVVAGYGYCGRGVASRLRGMGARVVVTEVDPTRALDAALAGYAVLPMAEAAPQADLVVTVTGNRDVVRGEHLATMKDGAVLANSGHFDVEIDVRWLEEHAVSRARRVRPETDEFTLPDGRRLLLLADGRLANLGVAEGHPPAVMDLSFANQALVAAWLAGRPAGLAPGVHDVPAEIDGEVARLSLAAMGLGIDALTPGQVDYLGSWEHGS